MNKKIKEMTCECGNKFHTSSYTAHNQTHCTAPKCVRKRKLEKNNRWRKKMKEEDTSGEWRRKANLASYLCNKERRARDLGAMRESTRNDMAKKDENQSFKETIAGLAAFIGDITTFDDLIAFLAKMKLMGRKLLP